MKSKALKVAVPMLSIPKVMGNGKFKAQDLYDAIGKDDFESTSSVENGDWSLIAMYKGDEEMETEYATVAVNDAFQFSLINHAQALPKAEEG